MYPPWQKEPGAAEGGVPPQGHTEAAAALGGLPPGQIFVVPGPVPRPFGVLPPANRFSEFYLKN